MSKYPRQVSILGSDTRVSAVVIMSKLNTCGMLVLGRKGGPSPAGPSPNNPNEYYIWPDGTNPIQPRVGGVNEVLNNPLGGVAWGPIVPQSISDYALLTRYTALGSDRVSSSVKICGPEKVSNNVNLPAFGIMYNGGIRYFYVTEPAGVLAYGDEVAWQAGDATNAIVTAPAGSGSLGNRRDGRTTFGNDDESEALVIASSGRSGALIFASGDHKTAVTLYIDATGTPKWDNAANWYAYATS